MLSATKNTLAFVLFCSFGATREQENEGVTRTYVHEGDKVTLHCSFGGSLQNTVIDWKNQDSKEVFLYDRGWHFENGRCCQDEQYRERASLFYGELKNGNASMILRDTRIEDTGNYTCVLPHVSSRGQRSTTELIVELVYKNRFGLKKGAVHAPYLKIVGVSEAGVKLQCVVRGSSSKPSVEWQTCEGTSLNSEEPLVSETRGRYDTKLLVTVNETKTNCFRCVVKQEDIYHRIDDEIVVPEKLFEKNSSHKTRDLVARGNDSGHGCDTGALVGMWVFGAAVVVALLGALTLCWLRRRNTRRRRRGAAQANASGGCDGDAVVQEPGRMSRHGSAKSGTSTNSRSSYCNVSSNLSSPPPSPAPRSTSAFPPPTSPLVLSS